MSEYIYLTSNTSIISRDLNYFHFESNVGVDSKKTFSFSRHFSNTDYQVESLASSLPNFKKLTVMKKGGPISHPATNELLDYIHAQFNQVGCNKIEILFSLNAYTNVALNETYHILLRDLSILDLYFQHSRLIVIHKECIKVDKVHFE